MELSHEIRRIRSFSPALPIALELLVEQAQYADRDIFLSDVLPVIGDAVSAGRVELVERYVQRLEAAPAAVDQLRASVQQTLCPTWIRVHDVLQHTTERSPLLDVFIGTAVACKYLS